MSNEAAALFQKYCEKVKDVKDDKGFAKSRPQSRDDMKGTKERVRQALMKEQEEKLHPAPRVRVSHAPSSSHKSDSSVRKGVKELYDPKAEREAEEKKRKEEEMKKKANIKRKPMPPPMNFNDLLKLAEKKQFEPVTGEVVEVKPKVKEPERLLTAKEKKELEDREARKNNKLKPQMPPPRIPIKEKPLEKPKEDPKKMPVKQKTPYNGPTREFPPKINGNASSSSTQSQKKPVPKEVPLKTREFPPKDIQKTRQFPPKDTIQKSRDTIQKTREFPPPDVRRPKPSSSSHTNPKAHKSEFLVFFISRNSKLFISGRIIEDEDSEDYDSEMDDFIDDGEEDEDYSKHIRDIFKYDKSKYRDEYDDEPMESSFAQMQREEAFSKKMGEFFIFFFKKFWIQSFCFLSPGLKEDLEDMRLEEEAQKKKALMKKKMKYR